MHTMSRVLRLFGGAAVAVLLAWASGAQAAKKPAVPATLEQRLNALLQRGPVRRSEMGVVVRRLGDSASLVSLNAERPFILASTTKLFTTAAALDRLGPLVVKGGGDPGLSGRWYEDDPLAVFRPWAASLTNKGIRAVRDGLLLAVSFFD